MTIKDKMLHPYFIEVKKGNVKVERINISNQDDDTKESKEYTTTECYPASVPGALRKIERIKQENADVTINLTQYLAGLDKKIQHFDNLLDQFDFPNYEALQLRMNILEKELNLLKAKIENR